jgi:hypothetical protein
MSLNDWAKAGWLKPHRATRQQVAAVFRVVDRDLEDSRQSLSADGQFWMPAGANGMASNTMQRDE